MIGKIFLFVGIGCILYAISLHFTPLQVRLLDPLDQHQLGSAFQGNLSISRSTITSYIGQIDDVTSVVETSGLFYARVSSWLTIISMVLTGVITILSGIQSLGINFKSVSMMVGVLGIVCTVSIGFGAYAKGESAEQFSCIDTINSKLPQTLELVRLEPDPYLAERYLKERFDDAKRCDT